MTKRDLRIKEKLKYIIMTKNSKNTKTLFGGGGGGPVNYSQIFAISEGSRNLTPAKSEK
jgi:hypothetical protein